MIPIFQILFQRYKNGQNPAQIVPRYDIFNNHLNYYFTFVEWTQHEQTMQLYKKN